MDLKQLEYFVTCAKLSSLTKAADALYTTQPHVSMVIRSLEKELNMSLFKRQSKGVVLTDEGMQIYGYAEKTLKDADMVRQASREKGGSWLRIASNPSSYMASVLANYYGRLQEKGITLCFTECGIEEMLDRMATEQYDLGFVFAPMDRKYALDLMARKRRLEYVELFRSGLVVHAGEKHPCFHRNSIRPSELADFSYIQADDDYFTVQEWLGEHKKNDPDSYRLTRVISTNSDHMMIRMLQQGTVCNLGSYWIREKFKEYNFRMIPVEGYEDRISFGYLKAENEPLRDAAWEFMEYLQDEILSR